MIRQDEMGLKDNVLIELFGLGGDLKDSRLIHNTVTTSGKYGVMDNILTSPTLAKMGWGAVGTGTPSATLLGGEIARVAFTSKLRSTNVVTVVIDFPAGTGTGALTEAGTFNVVTANTIDMWMSATFAVINKGALDTLKITWTLTGN